MFPTPMTCPLPPKFTDSICNGNVNERLCGYPGKSGLGFLRACGSSTGYIPSWSCGWSGFQHSGQAKIFTFFVLITSCFNSFNLYRNPQTSHSDIAILPLANLLPMTYPINIWRGTNRSAAFSRSSPAARFQASSYDDFRNSKRGVPSGIFMAM